MISIYENAVFPEKVNLCFGKLNSASVVLFCFFCCYSRNKQTNNPLFFPVTSFLLKKKTKNNRTKLKKITKQNSKPLPRHPDLHATALPPKKKIA